MPDIVDLAFPVAAPRGACIPADHGYPLFGALCRRLDWLHREAGEAVQVHPVRGQLTGQRRMRLTPESAVTLRAPVDRIADTLALVGETLDLEGTPLRLGAPRVEPLWPAPELWSRLVVIHGLSTESGPFFAAAQHQLERLRVSGRVQLLHRRHPASYEGGDGARDSVLRRTLRIAGQEIVGYPVRVGGLSSEDSMRLQAAGLGGRRHFGAGVMAAAPDLPQSVSPPFMPYSTPGPAAPERPSVLLPALAPYQERYGEVQAGGVPFRVRAVVRHGSPVVSYDAPLLAGLLAYAVAAEATGGRGVPPDGGPYETPLPLAALWRSPEPEGLALWAATPFRPVGVAAPDVVYRHRRSITGEWSRKEGRGRFTVNSVTGRHMERRTPVPTSVALAWEADAVGDPAEVGRLLERLAFLGKYRSVGMGEIAAWEVEPLEVFDLAPDGRLALNLPAAAMDVLDGAVPEGAPSLVGWTPPYWLRGLQRPGWRAGTEVC